MFNYSKGISYHTQRNNKVIPFSACNSTSMVMALKQAGYTCDWGKGQPEDVLTLLLLSKKYWDMMDSLNPALRSQGYRPNEVHACLCAATNELIGQEVVKFSTKTKFSKMQEALLSGGGVVLSGTFTNVKGNKIGHIVSLAGLDDTGAIIDDPYGNPKTNYKDYRGNDIMLTIGEFRDCMKGEGSEYWAHIVRGKDE